MPDKGEYFIVFVVFILWKLAASVLWIKASQFHIETHSLSLLQSSGAMQDSATSRFFVSCSVYGCYGSCTSVLML